VKITARTEDFFYNKSRTNEANKIATGKYTLLFKHPLRNPDLKAITQHLILEIFGGGTSTRS